MSDKDTQKSRFSLRAKRFQDAEDGAVSVDWVVLTAAAVGMAAGAGNSITEAVTVLSGTVETEVSAKEVDNGN
ncbi:MAG: hypothetical protein AAF382_12180 [Pseudomonadota bacterium]